MSHAFVDEIIYAAVGLAMLICSHAHNFGKRLCSNSRCSPQAGNKRRSTLDSSLVLIVLLVAVKQAIDMFSVSCLRWFCVEVSITIV
jgi:hypothetical protein